MHLNIIGKEFPDLL